VKSMQVSGMAAGTWASGSPEPPPPRSTARAEVEEQCPRSLGRRDERSADGTTVPTASQHCALAARRPNVPA
jgi:hypothetical protein